MNLMYLFDKKIMDLVISYPLGATVNQYENITRKEIIFLNL